MSPVQEKYELVLQRVDETGAFLNQ